MSLSKKIGIVLSIPVVIITILFTVDLSHPDKEITIGVTFSNVQAERLGLDWNETYNAILNDLSVKSIRIPAYWDRIERERGVFDFSELDYQLQKAQEKNTGIILALGHRVPRWPECFAPNWSKGIDNSSFEASLLSYMEHLVNHVKQYKNISHWQVENEPFLTSFGLCPPSNESLLRREITLVKSLDDRPVIITDSGELSWWNKAGKLGDIFGTTLYQKVWNMHLGYFEWLFPPAYYQIKKNIFVGTKPMYLMELEAEPWGSKDRFIANIPLDEQLKVFNENHLERYLAYAKRAGFEHIYLWGAEWWYWLKQNNHPELWDTAKMIFNAPETGAN